MKYALLLAGLACAVLAQQKFLPNQAGNDDIELVGKVLLEPAEIRQALGADLGPGYVLDQPAFWVAAPPSPLALELVKSGPQ